MNAVMIQRAAPTSPHAHRALRAYYDDIISRYYQRPAEPAEVEAVMQQESSDDLLPPHGLLLLACREDEVVGCVGLRILGKIGEVTRVHVVATARGQGIGSRLLTAIEQEALDHDLQLLRLDTRSDLVEARRLYARHGFEEVEPFNTEFYANHWFAKRLQTTVRTGR
ncbi:MAG: GNAT family N-acetyltransferase [Janthinobacterium lividum]